MSKSRNVPTAEKQYRAHDRDGEHVHVLRHEKQREFQSRILGVKSRDKLGLSLGQVERHTVRFGKSRDQKDKKSDELRDYVPLERRIDLSMDDAVQIERAGE